MAFVVYAYVLADAERAAMASRLVLFVVPASIIAAIVGLAHLRRLNLRPPPGLVYEEEEPGRIFEGFKLSEGQAAENLAGDSLPGNHILTLHEAAGILTRRDVLEDDIAR
jgi:hypothetical protein